MKHYGFKSLIGLFASILLVVACQKEEPIQQQNNTSSTNNTSNNNNGGSGSNNNGGNNGGGTTGDSLTMKFGIKTVIPTTDLDSIEIVHTVGYNGAGYMYDTLERLVIYPNNITLGNWVTFSNNDVNGVTDTVPPAYISGWDYAQDGYATGSEYYTLIIHANSSTNYNDPQNVFEFGHSNPNTASDWLTYTTINGHSVLTGGSSY